LSSCLRLVGFVDPGGHRECRRYGWLADEPFGMSFVGSGEDDGTLLVHGAGSAVVDIAAV
jgi:hypothetical protein